MSAGQWFYAKMAGRCANGFERGGGSLIHIVPVGGWSALCKAKPGRHSAGWSSKEEAAPTCPRCDAARKKLEAKS